MVLFDGVCVYMVQRWTYSLKEEWRVIVVVGLEGRV